MWRLIAGLIVLVAGSTLFLELMPYAWGVLASVALVGALAWRFGGCRHRGPLGLLPPTHDADGATVPARWFCDACGHTWPAQFERDHQPIARFTGYDESKAAAASRRADELAKRQRALAMRRAGLSAGAVKESRRGRFRADPAGVVHIGQARRFGP